MNQPFETDIHSTARRDRVAFVQSCWHRDIVDAQRDAFIDEFKRLDGRTVDLFEVPGAFEIPLKAKLLAMSGRYAGVAAAGLVVDGGIYRHEFVATAVIDGLMRAQLDSGVPVFSGVLTPHEFLAEGRAEFFRAHFVAKGVELAGACAATLGALSEPGSATG
ncbi:MAG: 6,7-dimethyl-8-ribityllumazine synthase [Proteobacteria bacterium]|jgi:6,7-dimethyl-8-ribityllumazine synthase|nr:6,7-dimethyl-8-ribityllumazine synthase [Pseudomonadota bacterium]MDA1300369.1 6,7-dimethyl-8-ribityllumazine synthase [Pseudomonadota bacterium]